MHALAAQTNLAPYEGQIYWLREFYPPDQATAYCQRFLHHLAWQEEQLFIYGRWLKVPRLMAWYF